MSIEHVVSRSTAGCYADQRTFDPTQGWCLAPQRAVTLTSGLLTLPRDGGQIKLFDFLVKSKDLSSAPRMVPLSVDLDPPRRGLWYSHLSTSTGQPSHSSPDYLLSTRKSVYHNLI